MTGSAKAFFDTFDRIYIINLLGRADRRNEMLEELKLVGIDPNEGAKWFFLSLPPEDDGGFPSLGARGCFMSHLAALRDARKHGHRQILIIEDDLSFNEYILTRQEEILQVLEETEWDMAYLGHILTLRPRQHFKLIPADPNLHLQCAHFLAVKNTVIPALVDYLEAVLSRPPGHPDGGPMHVDGAFNMYRIAAAGACRTFYAHPNLGVQRASHSDISPSFTFETYPGFAFLFSTLRRLKNKMRSRR